MPGLMKTFDALSGRHQAIVERMVDLARSELNDCDIKPMNDDRCAIFQEACAVYLNQSLLEADHAQAVLD